MNANSYRSRCRARTRGIKYSFMLSWLCTWLIFNHLFLLLLLLCIISFKYFLQMIFNWMKWTYSFDVVESKGQVYEKYKMYIINLTTMRFLKTKTFRMNKAAEFFNVFLYIRKSGLFRTSRKRTCLEKNCNLLYRTTPTSASQVFDMQGERK